MGTKTSNIHYIYENTKVIAGEGFSGSRFIAYDVDPNSPRAPMVGFGTSDPNVARALASHFKQMEKRLKEDAVGKVTKKKKVNKKKAKPRSTRKPKDTKGH